jgi:hypothetical protein
MMSKLSGILPATPRILSTDISGAQPQRPGSPRFWGTPDISDLSDPTVKSMLSTSALDRVSWSLQGKQGMNDPAIPAKVDGFQALVGTGDTTLRLPDFTPTPLAPAPDLSANVIVPASNERLNIQA